MSDISELAIEEYGGGVILPVKAQPGSGKNEIRGIHDGRLRVCITQVPERGRANKAIIALLSKTLAIPKSSLAIHSGHLSSQKKIAVIGMTIDSLRERVKRALNC